MRSVYYCVIFFCGLFFLDQAATAQVEQPKRTEIEVEAYDESYEVIPVGKYGVITFTQSDEKVDKKNKKWIFTSYDNVFDKKWSNSLLLEKHYYYRNQYFDGKMLYIMFGGYKEDEVKIARLDITKGDFEVLKITFLPKFSVHSFKVVNNSLYIDGTYKKKISLGYINLEDRIFKILPTIFVGYASIESIDIDTINKTASVVFSNLVKKKSKITIKTFSGSSQIGNIIMSSENNLLSGKLTAISEDEKIIIGTYSATGLSSQGMYISKISRDNNQIFTKYYPFTSFQNFLNYLPEKTKEKMEAKIAKKKAKGKDFSLNYNLLVHDVLKMDNHYTMIAEAYIPTYRTETRTSYSTGANGQSIMTTYTVQVFDGWLYTHATIAGFDDSGNMLWDNSFEMGDFKSFILKEKIKISVMKDQITLIYGSSNNIRTKVISGSSVVDPKDNTNLQTNYSDDKVKRSYLNNIDYWYGNYFIVYGFQKIKNTKNDEVKGKRLVFYFNKIAYK